MAKLTDAHKEQCRSMVKDGKRPCEIIDFFKTTYHIDIKSPTLNYIIHGRKGQGVASRDVARRKIKIRKISIPRAIQPVKTEEDLNSSEFVDHIRQAFNIYKKGFLKEVETIIDKEVPVA